MDNIESLWDQSLKSMQDKISKPSFETWLKSTKAHMLQGDSLTVIAPNEFARDWLEERYSHLISEVLLELTGEELEVKFIIPSNQGDDSMTVSTRAKKPKKLMTIQLTFRSLC